MDKQVFENISKMIDNAISGYESLLKLYLEKKQALLKPDKDSLATVDEKIMSHIKFLTDLNKEREKYCEENGISSCKITELIDLVKGEFPEFAETYEKQKVKIREVADKIAFTENTNVELLKHNLTMSDKLLDIIISAAMPQKDNYDRHGKNVDTSEISISSIVEDA